MAIDTPARLAIFGAGPLGLEAALYARFLGYDVIIYERRDVAANVRQVAQERLATPFAQNSTTLGIAAIQAQDEAYVPPKNDELLTHQEWLDRYLLPLSQTDLIADHLRLHTAVVAVEREQNENDDWSFRVLSRDTAGREQAEFFDGVLDCSGGSGNASWAATDVITAPHFHALGERTHAKGSNFAMPNGHDQIRRLFAVLGDRETLDLYASFAHLVQ